MIRQDKLKVGGWTLLAASAFAAGLVACSAGTDSTGGGQGKGTSNYNPGNGATAGSGGSGTAGSGNAGSGTAGSGTAGSGTAGSGTAGSGPAGGTGGSGATAGAGGSSAGTGGATGTAGAAGAGGSTAGAGGSTGTGCGQGTVCRPGNDLAPPDAADGFQVALPDGAVMISPGQELFYCYYKNVPGNAEVDVGGFESYMSEGTSHHFIVFQSASATGTDGSLVSCPIGSGNWVYATSTPGEIVGMNMPAGVGLPFTAGTQLTLNMHFINTGTTTVSPVLKLNVLYGKNIMYKAAAMVSFNVGINIPAGTTAMPGTQTVTGSCTAPTGSKFFLMSTHTHKHATAADVNYVSGGQSMNIVHSTDWEHPDVGTWDTPNFLTTKAGDSFTYSCAYSNTDPWTVTVGETAAKNEMCMAIGYFFPAGSASCH